MKKTKAFIKILLFAFLIIVTTSCTYFKPWQPSLDSGIRINKVVLKDGSKVRFKPPSGIFDTEKNAFTGELPTGEHKEIKFDSLKGYYYDLTEFLQNVVDLEVFTKNGSIYKFEDGNAYYDPEKGVISGYGINETSISTLNNNIVDINENATSKNLPNVKEAFIADGLIDGNVFDKSGNNILVVHEENIIGLYFKALDVQETLVNLLLLGCCILIIVYFYPIILQKGKR